MRARSVYAFERRPPGIGKQISAVEMNDWLPQLHLVPALDVQTYRVRAERNWDSGVLRQSPHPTPEGRLPLTCFRPNFL